MIGSPGAGKSRFAQRLAAFTGLPLTHLDEAYWLPNWTRRHSATGWQDAVREMVARDEWILDGNYPSTLRIRAARADHAIVLAPPRILCLYRVLVRAWLNRRPDNGVLEREPLDWTFVKRVWRAPEQLREELKQLEPFRPLTVTVLRTPKEIDRFFQSIVGLPQERDRYEGATPSDQSSLPTSLTGSGQ